MPPRVKKQRTSTSTSSTEPLSAVPPLPTFSPPQPEDSAAQTPPLSPSKRTTAAAAAITQAQKQALLDNLQLEITERARKLRAQYALQAQGLRARLEMRVNRIPVALRKRKIGELVEEYREKERVVPPPGASVGLEEGATALAPVRSEEMGLVESASAKRGVKRQSDQISASHDDEDKENATTNSAHPGLPNRKKRVKAGPSTTTAAANTKATRTTSRAKPPILSPKSHNPRSPFKPAPSYKPPPSPAKPSTTLQVPARAAASRAPSRVAKRAVPEAVVGSRESGASESSAGTTIVTQPGGKKGRVGRKAAAARGAAAGAKKVATAVKRADAGGAGTGTETGTGRRLRKRG